MLNLGLELTKCLLLLLDPYEVLFDEVNVDDASIGVLLYFLGHVKNVVTVLQCIIGSSSDTLNVILKFDLHSPQHIRKV